MELVQGLSVNGSTFVWGNRGFSAARRLRFGVDVSMPVRPV